MTEMFYRSGCFIRNVFKKNLVKVRIISAGIHKVIPNAFVEHRAIFDEPTSHHNVLVDFEPKPYDKLNLLTLNAYEGTREGLSLFWVEQYLWQHTFAENKLIIIIRYARSKSLICECARIDGCSHIYKKIYGQFGIILQSSAPQLRSCPFQWRSLSGLRHFCC